MKAPIEKHEEELIHSYILHTYLIKVLESDLKTIKEAGFKIHEPYIKLVEETLRKIKIKLRDMKAEMKKLEMKISDPVRDDIMFQYDFYVRGYHGFKRYWDAALKLHGTNLLEEYFNNTKR